MPVRVVVIIPVFVIGEGSHPQVTLATIVIIWRCELSTDRFLLNFSPTPNDIFNAVSISDCIETLLTPWFPLRQIGLFRPLRGDCTRLRDRRVSWIVSKGRAAFFISYIED